MRTRRLSLRLRFLSIITNRHSLVQSEIDLLPDYYLSNLENGDDKTQERVKGRVLHFLPFCSTGDKRETKGATERKRDFVFSFVEEKGNKHLFTRLLSLVFH